MPPESLWIQYSLVGILVLTTGFIAGAFYRLWKELLDWIEKQDKKRSEERETQREWEAVQGQARDAQWQAFMAGMQAQWLRREAQNAEVLEQLVEKINGLTVAVNNHDTWVRASGERK